MHEMKNFIPVKTAAEHMQLASKVLFLCQKNTHQPNCLSEQHIISWVFIDGQSDWMDTLI